MPARLRLEGLRSTLAGPFDLELAQGACLAITGASGSGKSLLLRMIADLDPSQGQVWLDGQERQGFTGPAWRRQVVYSAAEPGWWHETIAPHFAAAPPRQVTDLIAALGLSPALLGMAVARLSTGERQRLALIRALLADPRVLLLDEPTGALDPEATARTEAVLRARLATGTTLVLVTHSAEQASRLAARRLRMDHGRLRPA